MMSSLRTPTPFVAVSLTTVPPRVRACLTTLSSLVNQSRKPDAIFFNVPHTCARLGGERYVLPPEVTAFCERNGVTINRCEDEGPITKLLPTLRRELPQGALLMTADDDIAYPVRHLQGLLEAHAKHGCAVGYSGFYLLEYNLVQHTSPPGVVDVLEGYAGALYPRAAFDLAGFEAYLAASGAAQAPARLADDLLISNYLAGRGVRRMYVAAPDVDRQVMLKAVEPHAKDATALHTDAGNLTRYLTVARTLNARGALHLRNVKERQALYARLQGGTTPKALPERYLTHPNFLCDSMAMDAILAASIMRRRLERVGVRHVYLALTAIPSRFSKLQDVLLALSAQRLDVEAIIVSLPPRYTRFPEVDVEAAFAAIEPALKAAAPDLRVHRCREDYGPGTKLLGALEFVPEDALVLVCDDDTVYSAFAGEELCAKVAASPEACWAGCGFTFEEYFAEPYRGLVRTDSAKKDVAEGFAMVAYRAAWFRRPEWAPYFAAARPILQSDDDLLFSNYLAGLGVPIRMTHTPRYSIRNVHQLKHGFDGNALHQQHAEGSHTQARRRLLRRLAQAGLYRFTSPVARFTEGDQGPPTPPLSNK